MTPIARCDWLPKRARWSHLARSGLSAVSRKQNFPESHKMNPLLTKFARSRWHGIGLVLFLRVVHKLACVADETKPGLVSSAMQAIHKLAKNELGQYPANLTSHLVNNPYVMAIFKPIIQGKTDAPSPCVQTTFINGGQF